MQPRDQDRVKRFLEILHRKDRIPNALLFYGSSGVGKTTFSLSFSKGILCLKGEIWGCGGCSSCLRFQHTAEKIERGEWEELSVYEEDNGKRKFLYLLGEHPDFIFVPPTGSTLRIDQIRGIKEFVGKKPALSKRKVVIIDQAHRMTRESANALLKVLEEPPEDTHFILTSEGKEGLLPTILSRTYQVEFSPLDEKTFYELLSEENEELYRLSGGSLSLAKGVREERKLLDLADALVSSDLKRFYRTVEEAERLEGKEVLIYFLEERIKKSFLEGEMDYDRFEAMTDRLREIREGLSKGIRFGLALMTLHPLRR